MTVAVTRRAVAAAALLALPLVGLVLLVAQPRLDVVWHHNPAHFWLVLAAGGLNAVLAYATWSAAHRRGDARMVLVSLSFLSAAGFLGLHALATPGVLLAGSNAGFAMATPVGLLVSGVFAAVSSMELPAERARTVVRHGRLLLWTLIAVMGVWAAASLTSVPPLNNPAAPERASGWAVLLALAGLLLYAVAVVRYLRAPRPAGSMLPLAMASAFTLLAEAEVAVAWGRNWHASWWEWHLLMVSAFVIVAVAARRSWHEERWAGLYLGSTVSSEREISVLFADLQGFTSFSEGHAPQEVTRMLNAYFEEAIPPVVVQHGGEIDRLVGDALMATFNTKGNQPDHALRAARAALAIQRATGQVAEQHPDWPRFRVGVNTGDAAVGLLGASVGGRTFTAIGDTVNLASRLEGHAPVGGVAIGAETLRRLPGARVEHLGELRVKGKAQPVEAYRLMDL